MEVRAIANEGKGFRQRGKTDMEMPRAEKAGLKLETSWTEPRLWLDYAS